MSAESPMRELFRVGRFRFYWARRDHFTHPGLQVWTGSRHRRVLPVPKPK